MTIATRLTMIVLLATSSAFAAPLPGGADARPSQDGFATPFVPHVPTPKAAFDCGDVRRAALQLSVHAYNLANRTTTRTPQGGPYRPRTVECRGEQCTQYISRDAAMLVYQPGHADADAQGYVRYPAISISREFAAVSSAASELKLLASQEICGMRSIASGSTALIKYAKAVDAASDLLGFSADGRLTSWSRVGKDGRSYDLQFNSDGTVSAR